MLSEMTRERVFPWLGSIGIAVLCWFIVVPDTYQKAVDKLVAPVIEVSTIAVGFLLAVTTMLISMERRAVIQELRGIGFYNILLGYLRASIYTWFVVAAFSILTVLVNPKFVIPVMKYPWFRVGFTVWAFLVALGFLTSFRVARIMFALLRYGPRQQPAGHEGETESRLSLRAGSRT